VFPMATLTLLLAGCDLGVVEYIEGSAYWSFQTSGPVHSSPVIYDETVYIGSDDGFLYALGSRSGKERWRFQTGGGSASPAIADDAVFIGGASGWVYRLSTNTGSEEWSVFLGPGAAISAGVAVEDGVVYVGSKDRSLYALDAATGEEIWTFPTSNEIHSTPAVYNGIVYVGSWDGRLYAINTEDGTQRWDFKAGDYISGDPLVSDGQVFIGGEYEVPTADDGIFHAVSPVGSAIWSFWTGEGLHVSGGAAAAAGVAFFGTQDWYTDDRNDYMHAVSTASGQELWAYATPNSIIGTPTLEGGLIYFQDEQEFLYVLESSSGEEKWRYPTGGGKSRPAIDDSIVYVGGGNTIWAVREPR